MSKKNLLKEGTIRRFMKLAGTQVLASDFLTEQEEGGELEAEAPDLGGEDLEMDFADVAEEEPPVEGEEPEEEEGSLEDAVRAMVDAIADVAADFGVDVEVGEEETAELEVPEFEGEAEEAEEEEELELGGEEEEMALQELEYKGKAHADAFWEKTGDHWNCVVKETPKGSDLGGRSPTRVVSNRECAGKKKPAAGSAAALQERGVPEMSDKCKAACNAINPTNEQRSYCTDCKEWKSQVGRGTTSLEEINYIDEDAVMHEVFHRVKNRLVQEKHTDDMASMLAERIARRMNKRR